MVRLGAIQINLVPDSSDPPTYTELSPRPPSNSKPASAWQHDDPLTLREHPDPNYPVVERAPFVSSVSKYVEVTYNTGFRLDITLHTGFDFSGWGRLRFDIFVEGHEKGVVMIKKERYEENGSRAKLLVGGLPMWSFPLSNGQARDATGNNNKNSKERREVELMPLRFEDPGSNLTDFPATAGTVIVEARLCNEKAGCLMNSNLLSSFIFRYRAGEDLVAAGVFGEVSEDEEGEEEEQ